MGTIEDDLKRLKEEISQKLKETKGEIERVSGAGASKERATGGTAAGATGIMDNTTQCAYACPACLRSCCLTQGHYSSHQCSEGHSWL